MRLLKILQNAMQKGNQFLSVQLRLKHLKLFQII